MAKRIIICADGTWNRPEKDPETDVPTNVLRLARAVRPVADDNQAQHVFYDWGIGSYYDPVSGGVMGKGLHKNIMDNYRYIVQNYSDGDELFLFGFSRGAYTIRCLCGLINNCGILRRPDANQIQKAFDHYRNSDRDFAPGSATSQRFRAQHSYGSREVKFVGVWDTVGAMGIPISFLGFLDPEDEFYDTKIGGNVRIARHALALDEFRSDFRPTIWQPKENMDMKQVWFAGAHSDIGGGYDRDANGACLADIPLQWMLQEAQNAGLSIEDHLLQSVDAHKEDNPFATLNESRKSFYLLKKKYNRRLEDVKGGVLVHQSVKMRYERFPDYGSAELRRYIKNKGWEGLID